MSKATAALKRACHKLDNAIYEGDYLGAACHMALTQLSQKNFNEVVEEFEGDVEAARADLRAHYKSDVKRVFKDCARLQSALQKLVDLLPAVEAEQLESLEELEYTGAGDGD